jgi:hypothetical protein
MNGMMPPRPQRPQRPQRMGAAPRQGLQVEGIPGEGFRPAEEAQQTTGIAIPNFSEGGGANAPQMGMDAARGQNLSPVMRRAIMGAMRRQRPMRGVPQQMGNAPSPSASGIY